MATEKWRKDAEKRFRQLVKQADPFCPPSCKDEGVRDRLVQILIDNITTKRQYDDLFNHEEKIDSFSRKHSLSIPESELLGLMAEHKSVFKHVPLLDEVMTALFVAECAFVIWDMNAKGLLLLFTAFLFLTDSVISRVKQLSQTGGRVLSRFLFKRGFTDSDSLSGPIQMKKWTEQSWQLFVHASFALLEGYILSGEPWYDQPATCWIPHPYEQLKGFRKDLVVVYMAQLSIWIYTCVIHRFFDERRKDYYVMYVHHIATIALVACSFSVGYLRIGILVLWVHDVSDIFIDLLKMTNYLKLDGPKGWFGSEIAYVASLVAWVYWRLYRYPFRVLRGSWLEPYWLHAPQPRVNDGMWGAMQFDLPLWIELNGLLFLLLGLHIYWFKLLLGVGWRIITESTREASRQGYEGDSDGEGEGDKEKDGTGKALADSRSGATSVDKDRKGKGASLSLAMALEGSTPSAADSGSANGVSTPASTTSSATAGGSANGNGGSADDGLSPDAQGTGAGGSVEARGPSSGGGVRQRRTGQHGGRGAGK